MKPGDLIWLRDDMGVLTPAIYISDAPSSFTGPRIKVLHSGVVFDIGKHRVRVNNETRRPLQDLRTERLGTEFSNNTVSREGGTLR